jgi:hypothetical protein
LHHSRPSLRRVARPLRRLNELRRQNNQLQESLKQVNDSASFARENASKYERELNDMRWNTVLTGGPVNSPGHPYKSRAFTSTHGSSISSLRSPRSNEEFTGGTHYFLDTTDTAATVHSKPIYFKSRLGQTFSAQDHPEGKNPDANASFL